MQMSAIRKGNEKLGKAQRSLSGEFKKVTECPPPILVLVPLMVPG